MSPQNSTVALGQNGTFLCTAKKEIFWKVTPDRSSEGPFVRAERPNQEPTRPEIENFNISGLFISSAMTNETYTSHLILEGSNANNFTKVECAIFGRAFPTFAVLRVFGKLLPKFLVQLLTIIIQAFLLRQFSKPHLKGGMLMSPGCPHSLPILSPSPMSWS